MCVCVCDIFSNKTHENGRSLGGGSYNGTPPPPVTYLFLALSQVTQLHYKPTWYASLGFRHKKGTKQKKKPKKGKKKQKNKKWQCRLLNYTNRRKKPKKPKPKKTKKTKTNKTKKAKKNNFPGLSGIPTRLLQESRKIGFFFGFFGFGFFLVLVFLVFWFWFFLVLVCVLRKRRVADMRNVVSLHIFSRLAVTILVVAPSHSHLSLPMAYFRSAEAEAQDGPLTFDEACGQVNGMKLQGPERRPFRSDRAVGEVDVGDLPVRHLESSVGHKIEQFADALLCHPIEITSALFDNLYKICCESKFAQLPEPFNLKKEPSVPYTMQIIIQSSEPPAGGDPNGSYFHVFKHVYLHRNKLTAADCVAMCHGTSLRFEWGHHTRVALTGLNFMMDKMGGKQLRFWVLKPKYEKKSLWTNRPEKKATSSSGTLAQRPIIATNSWSGRMNTSTCLGARSRVGQRGRSRKHCTITCAAGRMRSRWNTGPLHSSRSHRPSVSLFRD